MKKFALLFLAISGFAALPPLHQSVREIEALLSDSHLAQYLGNGERINNIMRTENGFLVATQNYLMDVEVHYNKNNHLVGPAQFELEFKMPIDMRTGEVINFN